MASITVIDGGKGKTPIDVDRDAALRRLALQMAVQLPDDPKEAERVLAYLRALLGTFLADPTPF